MAGPQKYPEDRLFLVEEILLAEASSTFPNGSVLVEGTGISFDWDQAANTFTISSTSQGNTTSTYLTKDDERSDLPNSFRPSAGSNVTLFYDGSAGTLTISAATSSSGAPTASPYILAQTDGTLVNHRVIETGNGLDSLDDPGSNLFTVSLASSVTEASVLVYQDVDTIFTNRKTITGVDGIVTTVSGDSFLISPSGIDTGVTSVSLTLPSVFTVSGSPVTSTGTLTGAFVNQASSTVLAGPSGGSDAEPTFRTLVSNDIPNLSTDKLTSGTLPVARGGTGSSSVPNDGQVLIGDSGDYTPADLTAGWGIDINSSAGSITISSQATGEQNQNSYSNVNVPGWGTLSASIPTDTLQLSGIDGMYVGISGNTLILSPSGASGTLSSVGLSANPASIFSISGSPLTSDGSIALGLQNQTGNTVLASPSGGGSGEPAFRNLVPGDVPDLSTDKLTSGTLPVSRGGTGAASTPTDGQVLIAGSGSYTPADLTAGWGIDINSSAGSITISSEASGEANQNAFGQIDVENWPSVTPSSPADTLILSGGDNVTIATIPGSNTIVFNVTGVGGGGVQSVALDLPSDVFTISGSPVTDTGTLTGTFVDFVSGTVIIGPSGGADGTPSVRRLTGSDIFGIFTEGSNVTLTLSGEDKIVIASSGVGAASGYQTIQEEGSNLAQRDTLDFNTTLLTAADTGSKTQVTGHASLEAIVALGPSGFPALTDTDTWAIRSLQGTTNRIVVVNPSGVGGDPTFDVGSDVYVSGGTDVAPGDGGTGTSSAPNAGQILVGTNSNIYTPADLTAGANIVVTPGDGTLTVACPGASGELNQNAYGQIDVPGWSSLTPSSPSDTLLISGEGGIDVGTVPGSNAIIVSVTGLDVGVTSVDFDASPAGIFNVAGNPITGTGTISLSLDDQSANTVFAGPGSGGATTPGFRSLVSDDIPNLSTDKLTSGTLPIARGGTQTTTAPTSGQLFIGKADNTWAVADLTEGWGINLDAGDGTLTISSLATGEQNQNAFSSIAVGGQNTIAADLPTDTLTVVGSNNISITTDDTTDTLTISGASLQPLDADLTALAALSTTGMMARTDADTYIMRTITGTASSIDVTNGDGVSGNPTISISDNPVIEGTAGMVLPSGTTAQRTNTEGILRYNTDDNVFEGYDNDSWVQFGAGGGATPTVRSLPTSGTVTSGQYYHDGNWSSTGNLTFEHGVKAFINGTFDLNSGHTLTVLASGYAGGRVTSVQYSNANDGKGPGGGGGGVYASGGGAGGSFGGSGGSGGETSSGYKGSHYPAYSWTLERAGSGGGSGASDGSASVQGRGGNGGGGVDIEAAGAITINENFNCKGENGVAGPCPGGGGSGGYVGLKSAVSITVASGKSISVAGGNGADEVNYAGGGGGGGGGWIVLWAPTITIAGSLTKSGGSAGSGGFGAGAGSAGQDSQITSSPIFEFNQGT